jgi:lysophospholipase L1-like esterase
MIKKLLIITFYSLYFFLFLGFLLHTSLHPAVLHKYTLKYATFLFLFFISFFLILLLIVFMMKKTSTSINKKKYVLTSKLKIIVVLLLGAIGLLALENILRNQYLNYESSSYLFTLDNFHPFLQFQLRKQPDLPVNSYNFRGEEITVKKKKNTFRIFVLGGSTVLNSVVPYKKTLTYLLQEKLQKVYPNKRIEVINAGNDGYTSEHSLIQYLFKIKDFSPDMIIIYHGINDWYYSCSSSDKTYGTFKSDYSHELGADAQMVYTYFTPPPVLSIKLVSLDFLRKFLIDNLYSDLTDKKKYKDPEIYSNEQSENVYDMTSLPSLHTYERNMQSLITQLQADRVLLLVGDQPVLYSKTLPKATLAKLYFPVLHCTVNGKYPSLDSVITGMELFNAATKNLALKNNVPFVGLNASLPKTLDYFIDDVHFSAKGNQKIADTLYQAFISNHFIQNE